jgi:hypothetical protein
MNKNFFKMFLANGDHIYINIVTGVPGAPYEFKIKRSKSPIIERSGTFSEISGLLKATIEAAKEADLNVEVTAPAKFL